ncbi:MAG: hypothetical protein AAFY78_01105 [Cyanobacteria bacterium J06648_16]
MKRRFLNSKTNAILHLTVHSPGLYLYKGKLFNTKTLKALAIKEAPLFTTQPTPEPLCFGKPDAYKGKFKSSRV